MTVYVDELRTYERSPLREKRWCHMVADSHGELEAMARKIRMSPSWIQRPGTPSEHYDLVPHRRAWAIREGAVPVTSRELVEVMRRKIPAETLDKQEYVK